MGQDIRNRDFEWPKPRSRFDVTSMGLLRLSGLLRRCAPLLAAAISLTAVPGAAGAIPSGNVTADSIDDDELRQRKTLFRWRAVSTEPDQSAEEDNRLVTDRPHFSEASSLVGLGRVQLETGYSFFQDGSGAQLSQTHSFPEPLLRAGLFAIGSSFASLITI